MEKYLQHKVDKITGMRIDAHRYKLAIIIIMRSTITIDINDYRPSYQLSRAGAYIMRVRRYLYCLPLIFSIIFTEYCGGRTGR